MAPEKGSPQPPIPITDKRRPVDFDPIEALEGYPTPKDNAITSKHQTKEDIYDLLWLAEEYASIHTH